jgi:hypothetical protein
MAKPWNIVTPVEYEAREGGKKTRWVRIGAAFPKENGAWSLMFDALPVNGKAMIMEPREENGSGSQGGGF